MSGVAGAGSKPDAGPEESVPTNSFPNINEIFQGRMFASKFDRDVFFLKTIRESYPAQWAPLLGANILESDYVLAPDKLQKFVEELGAAVEGTGDLVAVTNLAVITSEPSFYANTNAVRPGILRAAARALIGIGPSGRQVLADSFSESHYRLDRESLEIFGDAAGESGVSDPRLTTALAATAFTFTATNGGYYSECTRKTVVNLLRLPGGTGVVRSHLNEKEIFDNPGRFQDVVDAIVEARVVPLYNDLGKIAPAVDSKLKSLPASADPYRKELSELKARISDALDPQH
jgi:hypothetical protein